VYSPHFLHRKGKHMRSSTQYAELAGLRIALSGLTLYHITEQDQAWCNTVAWIESRIKELEKL
jgi:hypothetical protein